MAIARRGTPTTAALTASATTVAISVPTGVVNGDVLFLCVWGDDATGTITDPAGWTAVTGNPVSPANGRGKVWWRVAASEPASYTISFSSNKWVAVMVAYSGVDTTTPLRASSWKAETVAGTSHTTNSVTANANDWLLSFFMDRSTTSTAKNTNWTATSPAIEWVEVNDNAAASSPWLALEANDSNGVVTAGAKTHTSVSVISQANAAMWIGVLALAAASTTPVSGSDSATGTDAQSSLSVTATGAETATGTDTGSVSVTLSGSDSATGTDSGSVVQPTSGSDTGTGTDTGAVSATLPGADSATGTDTGSVQATATDSETATGTDAGAVQASGSSADTASGSDSGAVSVTLSDSDTATGTDAGTVADITGGATVLSDSDAATGVESATLVDLTPPPPPDEDLGDTSSIWTVPPQPVYLSDTDFGVGVESAVLTDLTPKPRLRVILPRRTAPSELHDNDHGIATETASLRVFVEDIDAGAGIETEKRVETEDLDEVFVLMVSL